MNIHEYQAKELLKKFNVPVLQGQVAFTPNQAEQAFLNLKTPVCAVKAQIHAGGRGKAGGVKIVKSSQEAKDYTQSLLGVRLVTHQTGAEGQKVGRVYVEAGCDIERELYLSLLLDRSLSRLTFIASAEGGVEIEEVAEKTPHKIIKVSIDPTTGYQSYQGRQIAFALGLQDQSVNKMISFLKGIYQAFTALDMSLLEINPLVLTKQGDLYALDAKVSFDDNGLFRHPEVEALRDEAEEDPMELEANRHGLSYVKLEGNIGCMVNGAGLAMATMDVIKLYGGDPANFLDVGGGATKERVTAAFKLIMSDQNVQGILVNIFGGIMRCDIIAEGIIAAAQEVALRVPLVVRLEGTNVNQGKAILAQSNLTILSADNLGDAAQKIVQAVKEAA